MSRTRFGLSLFVLCLLSLGALGMPDLVVADIRIEPELVQAGDIVRFEAVIENIGETAAPPSEPFFVRILIDGREIDIQSIHGGIAPGRTKSVTTEWIAMVGTHVVSVEADEQLSRVDESDEQNNVDARPFTVFLDQASAEALGTMRIAVSTFVDQSGSGFLNLGEGIADELTERLRGTGLRVVDRMELDDVLRVHDLNPSIDQDLAFAASLLGADILIAGAVPILDVIETSLQLGFISIDGAEVHTTIAARVLEASTGAILSSRVETGQAEGATGFTFDLGGLLSTLEAEDPALCGGGLRSAKTWYNVGEPATFAYRNPGADDWFSVEITTNLGTFVKWIGWQYVATNDCGVWYWDQLNSSGFQMAPGLYTAKLWDGTAYVDTVDFQVRPGISISAPPLSDITMGSPAFEDSVVGEAVRQGIDGLTASLLNAMAEIAPGLSEPMGFAAMEAEMPPIIEGQVASILPDGRIALNVGASVGVAAGDVFEVLEVSNVVVDPNTSAILSYDPIHVRGEVVVTEVRDLVSFAVPTTGFTPSVGDVVRFLGH